MLFNSLTFVFFLAIVLAVNGLLRPERRNAWILACGLLFYMSWNPPYVALLLATAAIDYKVALKMGALPDRRARRPWLIASLLFSLGSLGFFKYANMALDTAGIVARLWGSSYRPPLLDLVLPLGISFYTFETISYGVDVYRGDLQPKRSFFQYLSFLMFFPKLIAGPIVRASELLPQIPAPRRCDRAGFAAGVNLLAIGYVKKVLFADNFAPFVERVFEDPSAHNRWMCLVAAYGYSMQVYFDFSAYSDIASGCARLLGYELPRNFDKPYLATSIGDFWRRWHMSLSRWLRDYLYIPLGGNHGSRLANYRNLFLTMLLGGLWHGAQWTFVAWGAMNGLFLLVEKAYFDARGRKPKREADMTEAEKWIRRVIVFHLITLTRVFFRAPSFGVALDLLGSIARPRTSVSEAQVGLWLIPLASIAFVLASPLRRRIEEGEPAGGRLIGYALVLLALLLFGASQAEFIYFQF